jgi:hypothetical protein
MGTTLGLVVVMALATSLCVLFGRSAAGRTLVSLVGHLLLLIGGVFHRRANERRMDKFRLCLIADNELLDADER